VLLNAFGGKTGSIIVERASLVVASERSHHLFMRPSP